MSRSISIFGLGYVGSVTAACLANSGNKVLGVDLNPVKVGMIDSGRSPILEPATAELVEHCNRACRLHATLDGAAAVLKTEISFICVGTPSLRSGKLDLRHIEAVSREIGQALARKNSFHLVVLRSTVLPGTTESVVIPILEKFSGKRMGTEFGVCVNPEFMREGSAVHDFLHPAMTILGASYPEHSAILREIYQETPGRMFETSFPVAEMVKYVCNAWHAVKVSFANEVGTLCKEMEVDTEAVTEIFSSDNRLNISAAYLKPGFAFGGSCLPKDVRSLNYRAKELDLRLPLIEAVLPSNLEHLERALQLVLHTGKKKIAVLGLSFKAGTDDLRESPQVQLIKRLLGEGCKIQIWDDNVSLGRLVGSNRQFIEEVIPHLGSLLASSLEEVVEGAEVVLIGTHDALADKLTPYLRSEQIVIDLVNLEKLRRPKECSSYEGLCW